MLKNILLVSALATGALQVLTGCAANVDPPNVKTDYGVTATQIHLGALTDLSKDSTESSASVVAGNQLYFADRNKKNPICGREVVIDVKDHSSESSKALTLFQSMEPNILALAQLMGAPQQQAMLPAISEAGLTAMIGEWSSTFLVSPGAPNNKFYVLSGTTYPLDVINGLSWLQESGKIKKGDGIGYLNIPGTFGADSYAGGRYFADKAGFLLNHVEIAGNESDLSAQVNGLLTKNISALVVSADSSSVNAVVAAVKASAKNIPILIQAPGFAPSAVASNAPNSAFYQSNVFITTSILPASDASTETLKYLSSVYTGAVKAGTIKEFVVNDQQLNKGWAMASILGQALDAACRSGDMTRGGLNKAVGTLSKVVTGVSVDVDYTNRSKSPSASSYILSPDAGALGKSRLVKNLGTTALAADFQAGK